MHLENWNKKLCGDLKVSAVFKRNFELCRVVASMTQDKAITLSWFQPKIDFSEEKCHRKCLKEHFWAFRFKNFLVGGGRGGACLQTPPPLAACAFGAQNLPHLDLLFCSCCVVYQLNILYNGHLFVLSIFLSILQFVIRDNLLEHWSIYSTQSVIECSISQSISLWVSWSVFLSVVQFVS